MAKTKFGSNATFTGTGLGLNVVNDWAYATTTQGTKTSLQTMLDFETGAYVLVSKLYVSAGNHLVTAEAGSSSSFRVKFNGVNVALARCESDLESGERGTPAQAIIPLIIPPLTTVEVIVDSDVTDADKYTSVFLSGRIYA